MRTATIASILIPLACALIPAAASAHGVNHRVERGEAHVVTFTHDDGSPFANVPYEVTAPGDVGRASSGRTDRLGRVAFLPDIPGDWIVRAWSANGHGGRVVVDVGDEAITEIVDTGGRGRGGDALLGVSLLFGLFGVAALVMSRRRG